jgi:hypothetical protein
MTTDVLLRVSGLTIGFPAGDGYAHAADGVDFEVAARETLASSASRARARASHCARCSVSFRGQVRCSAGRPPGRTGAIC